MIDITAIILTYNEEIHIRRCLENVNKFCKKVYVVDCFSTDRTKEIAEGLGAEVFLHKWPGNQAEQFNWAIKALLIETEWILRLDADEYLLPELIEEIELKLPSLARDISGVVFNRRHIFMDKWVKRGIYPVKLLRLFRSGQGEYEQRLMDEHIQLKEGRSVEFTNDFCDHNLNDLSFFCHKHVNYAVREAAELLDLEYNISNHLAGDNNLSEQAQQKRNKKLKYARQPLFLRAFFYFCYRYFFKGAILEGKVGFIWTFLQGWWYRTLVDANIFEIKRICGNDKEKIRNYLKQNYNISL